MSERYLVNIAVGPVQEFIASARKLRDLWYGSYLLSELSKSVARFLHEQGCELIFPAIENKDDLKPGSVMNVANKILALSPEGVEPKTLIEKSKAAFKDQWRKICNEAKPRAGHGTIDHDLFTKQVEDFGEFYGAWTLLSPDDYPSSLHRCDQLLAGRKSLREFNAPSWPGTGKPKSSLDGIRESVIIRDPTENRAFQIKEGEELDALGIVKRFGPWNHNDRPHFDNLAQVAAEPFLSGLAIAARADHGVAELINRLPDAAALYPVQSDRPPGTQTSWDGWPRENGLSTELLHPSVLEAELRIHDSRPESSAWSDLSATLHSLWKKTSTPSPYVCLLVGDGDNMGKTLNQLRNVNAHQQFSKELDRFARNVHETVSAKAGKVVYSGGDDVMAYVPLHTVLECAAAINTLFYETMRSACTGSSVNIPTFSMGIVIVHMRMPMHTALAQARQAEQSAKDQGKDCLALIQSKRGGSDLLIHGGWQNQDQLPALPERLAAFAEAYSQRLLSSRLAYQLRSISKECGEGCGDLLRWNEIDTQLQPATAATAEAMRLICHKKSGDNKISKTEAEQLLIGQNSIRHLSDELIMAHQLSRALDLGRAAWTNRGGNNND